jgi:hypothetical protein
MDVTPVIPIIVGSFRRFARSPYQRHADTIAIIGVLPATPITVASFVTFSRVRSAVRRPVRRGWVRSRGFRPDRGAPPRGDRPEVVDVLVVSHQSLDGSSGTSIGGGDRRWGLAGSDDRKLPPRARSPGSSASELSKIPAEEILHPHYEWKLPNCKSDGLILGIRWSVTAGDLRRALGRSQETRAQQKSRSRSETTR